MTTEIPTVDESETPDLGALSLKTSKDLPDDEGALTSPETKPLRVRCYDVVTDGDLMLQINDSERNIQVNTLVFAGALKAVSPVWSRMLDKSSPMSSLVESESGDTKQDVVTLNEDNASALFVILWGAHHRQDKIPTSVSFEQLLSLAIVCSKYDCAVALQGSIQRWIEKFFNSVSLEHDMGYENWFFIAETFGSDDKVQALGDEMHKTLKVTHYHGTGGSKEKVEYSRAGSVVNIDYVPQKYIDCILENRERHLQWLCDKLTAIESYLSSDRDDCFERTFKFCEDIMGPGKHGIADLAMAFLEPQHEEMSFDNCADLAYGSFARALKGLRVWGYATGKLGPKDWTSSVEDFQKLMQGIQLRHDDSMCPMVLRQLELIAVSDLPPPISPFGQPPPVEQTQPVDMKYHFDNRCPLKMLSALPLRFELSEAEAERLFAPMPYNSQYKLGSSSSVPWEEISF